MKPPLPSGARPSGSPGPSPPSRLASFPMIDPSRPVLPPHPSQCSVQINARSERIFRAFISETRGSNGGSGGRAVPQSVGAFFFFFLDLILQQLLHFLDRCLHFAALGWLLFFSLRVSRIICSCSPQSPQFSSHEVSLVYNRTQPQRMTSGFPYKIKPTTTSTTSVYYCYVKR